MTTPRSTRVLEELLQEIGRRQGAPRTLVEVVLEDGERFAISDVYGHSRRYVVFDLLPGHDAPAASTRIVPIGRIRYLNVYTDPASLPPRYAGSWTVGFAARGSSANPAPGAG